MKALAYPGRKSCFGEAVSRSSLATLPDASHAVRRKVHKSLVQAPLIEAGLMNVAYATSDSSKGDTCLGNIARLRKRGRAFFARADMVLTQHQVSKIANQGSDSNAVFSAN